MDLYHKQLLWGLQVLLLLIADFAIQQNASYALSNFALYQEVSISSNKTCGLLEKEEFCAAIDRRLQCRQGDFCSMPCSIAETAPGSLDLVATGMFHGEVTKTCNV